MAQLRTPITLPEVTDAHRATAFERFAWKDFTYEQAMADKLRSRLIEARAHQLRKQEWKQSKKLRPTVLIPTTGHAKPLASIGNRRFWPIDLKRAAAGDVDD